MGWGMNADGRLEVFALGSDNAIWHTWQPAPNSGPWARVERLGGTLATAPTVITFYDRLRLFARGNDGALWHTSQDKPNDGWGLWQSHGGFLTDDPAVANNRDGLLQVFTRWTDGTVRTCVQEGPDGIGPWRSLGGRIQGSPTIGQNTDGRLEVFARGQDGALWHTWQLRPNTGADGWSEWQPLPGGPVSHTPMTAILNRDGRLDVHFTSVNNQTRVIWQTAANNGWAGPANTMGESLSPIVSSRNADGRLEVFCVGTNGSMYHCWQTSPNNGYTRWSGLRLRALRGKILAARNADQRLEAFGINDVGNLVHTWQHEPSAGPWSQETIGGATLGGLGVRLVGLGTRSCWRFRE